MNIRAVQWNIGGGKLLHDGADPTLLSSYKRDGINDITNLLREIKPDIITLQETHAADGLSQSELIAHALGYEYWVNDEYADSHIEEGQRLGQGIVSRFPITHHSFEWFTNPNFEVVWEDGSMVVSHDKGRTKCRLHISSGQDIEVQTLHSIPFRRFNIDIGSDKAKEVLSDMATRLVAKGRGIIQGDFNLDSESLADMFPSLFEEGFQEIMQHNPTTPKGRRYDHVLYKGLDVLTCEVIEHVATDHYPVVTDFRLSLRS